MIVTGEGTLEAPHPDGDFLQTGVQGLQKLVHFPWIN
jgi:hypothetical protein